MRRTIFKLLNLPGQAVQKLILIEQSGAQQDVILNRVGHAFTEPQRIGVVLFRVIHRLERLRPDSLHIPEVKKLVRRHVSKRQGIVGQHLRVDFNRS